MLRRSRLVGGIPLSWFSLFAMLVGSAGVARGAADGPAISFIAGPKDAAERLSRVAGDGIPFRDCAAGATCPEMVVIPASPPGFQIGSPASEPDRLPSEEQFGVTIKAFALEATEVSTAQYLACAKASACRYPEWLEPGGEHNIETGHGVTYKSIAKFIRGDDQPIVGVSWDDAVAYTKWLSDTTGHHYRLPSEAEWEYAARAGSATAYWWGNQPKRGDEVMASCRGCGSEFDAAGFAPVKSFKANPWGLYNVHGNVWEWVADFYCDSYASAPTDGSPRTQKSCPEQESPEGLRVFRGGSSFYEPRQMRAAMRLRNWPSFRNQTVGFRVARDLAP
jgi:formylglycine-generating enzyme required for sulfatase activity